MGALISRPVCGSVGALYPAYASFKALETPQTDDDKQWLTYWVVFAVTSTAEEVAEKIISWIPGYYLLKMMFLVWLMLPKTRGAVLLYKHFLYPMIKKYEPLIDEQLKQLQIVAQACIEDLKENGVENMKQIVVKNYINGIAKAKMAQEMAAQSPLAGKMKMKMREQVEALKALKKRHTTTPTVVTEPVEEPLSD